MHLRARASSITLIAPVVCRASPMKDIHRSGRSMRLPGNGSMVEPRGGRSPSVRHPVRPACPPANQSKGSSSVDTTVAVLIVAKHQPHRLVSPDQAAEAHRDFLGRPRRGARLPDRLAVDTAIAMIASWACSNARVDDSATRRALDVRSMPGDCAVSASIRNPPMSSSICPPAMGPSVPTAPECPLDSDISFIQ